MQANMAFRTEALPTQLCKNHNRREFTAIRECDSICKAMAANRRISNKEHYESLSS